MRRVKLICFGRLKEPHWRLACAEYEKRLGAYCRLETVELSPALLPDEPSPAQVRAALEQEARLVLPKLPRGAGAAALCVEGRQMASEQLGAWIEAQPGEIVFLIGSSCGLSESLKARAQLRLSLSAMTFPHQLARVMLLEQLYRAFQINIGGKYHK
jgi:23S rRNA (pseudouridine1915-N3)-methyltransferase